MSATTKASLGTRAKWARDFAFLGALSAGLVPLVAMAGGNTATVLRFTGAAMLFGALGGLLVGLISRRFVAGLGGRLPVGLLLLAGPLVGALWGVATGGAAAWAWWWSMDASWSPTRFVGESMQFAGIAAAIQFGWFWLPYVLGTVRRRGKLALWLLAGISAAAVGLLIRLGFLG